MAAAITHQNSMDAADTGGRRSIVEANTIDTFHPDMPGTASAAVTGNASHTVYSSVGSMAMPADFRYKTVHLKGRPRHEKYSTFWCRHIPMDCAHRAKIFVAFDALKGFDEAIEEVQRQSENAKDVETCVPDIM